PRADPRRVEAVVLSSARTNQTNDQSANYMNHEPRILFGSLACPVAVSLLITKSRRRDHDALDRFCHSLVMCGKQSLGLGRLDEGTEHLAIATQGSQGFLQCCSCVRNRVSRVAFALLVQSLLVRLLCVLEL